MVCTSLIILYIAGTSSWQLIMLTLHRTHPSCHCHGMYQICEPEDIDGKQTRTADANDRSLKNIPDTILRLLECPKPEMKPSSPNYPQMEMPSQEVLLDSSLPEYAWLISRELVRSEINASDGLQMHIPTWSALNSQASTQLPMNRVGTFHLFLLQHISGIRCYNSIEASTGNQC